MNLDSAPAVLRDKALAQARHATGLPAGIQIMSPNWEDATPVTSAGLLSRELGGFVRPPGFTE